MTEEETDLKVKYPKLFQPIDISSLINITKKNPSTITDDSIPEKKEHKLKEID